MGAIGEYLTAGVAFQPTRGLWVFVGRRIHPMAEFQPSIHLAHHTKNCYYSMINDMVSGYGAER